MQTDRLRAKTIKEAYPANDSPRENDAKAVKYFMSASNISPIFMCNGILLDGVHRCVAAALSGKRKVRAIFIEL